MSLEDIVRTNEVILERFDMAVKATLSNEMMCSLSNVETELYIEPTLKAMIYELRARLASEKLGHVDIKYPKDWWQALKERWFPKWLLKRYPVQYHEERYDVRAFYPKISIPKESHYIRFIKFDLSSLIGGNSNTVKELTVQEVVQGIKEHKELIQQQVRQGDAKAKALTDFYYIAQRHSDTSSRTLLIRAYEDWARQNLIPLFDIE